MKGIQLFVFVALVLVYPAIGWIYFRDVRCTASNKTALSNFSCYLKKLGPHNNSVNVELFIPTSINKAGGSFYLSYSRTLKGPYVKIMDLSAEDACPIMKKLDTPFARWFVEKGGEALKKQAHPCPYQGEIDFVDIIPIGGHYSACPQGFFTGILKFFKDDDENIFQVTFGIESKFTKRNQG